MTIRNSSKKYKKEYTRIFWGRGNTLKELNPFETLVKVSTN